MSTILVTQNHKEKHIYQLILIIKSWDKNLTITDRNILLAEALNYCVERKGIQIKGYVIAKRRLFLILKSKHHNLDKILNYLAKKIVELIYEYQYIFTNADEESLGYENSYRELFKKQTLYNPYIIKILTGKKIKLPYENSHIEKLKAIINTYNYCSTIDYSGAIGPVIVHTK